MFVNGSAGVTIGLSYLSCFCLIAAFFEWLVNCSVSETVVVEQAATTRMKNNRIATKENFFMSQERQIEHQEPILYVQLISLKIFKRELNS